MRLLLDTHIFLWAVAGSPLLKAAARRTIQSADQVYVSAASIWEVAIKAPLGKIKADPDELVAGPVTLQALDSLVTHPEYLTRLCPGWNLEMRTPGQSRHFDCCTESRLDECHRQIVNDIVILTFEQLMLELFYEYDNIARRSDLRPDIPLAFERDIVAGGNAGGNGDRNRFRFADTAAALAG